MMAGENRVLRLLFTASLAVVWHIGSVPAAVPNETHGLEAESDGADRRHSLGPGIMNPHGDVIFRATGTTSCRDCHRVGRDVRVVILNNAPVRKLIEKGRGNHGPGRFADCFRCHAGGTQGIGTD